MLCENAIMKSTEEVGSVGVTAKPSAHSTAGLGPGLMDYGV